MKIINPQDHPVGTRLLLGQPHSSLHPSEVSVLEWSPEGRPKLRHESGSSSWYDLQDIRYRQVVEVLGAGGGQ